MLKNATVSWKTTVAGVLAALAMASPQLQALFDSDPTTLPDWNIIAAAVMVALGLSTARDGDKSSQDMGVRK